MAAEGPKRSPWRIAFGLAVSIGLGCMFAWVAFGPGPRDCAVSVSVTFLARHGFGGATLCRGAFGVATLLALAISLLGATAALRLRGPGRFADALEKAGQWLAILVLAPLLVAAAVFAAPLWLARWAARRATSRRASGG